VPTPRLAFKVAAVTYVAGIFVLLSYLGLVGLKGLRDLPNY
jgi:hypothetical protein